MTTFTRFKLFLWYFSHFKVAMIGYTMPRLIKLDDRTIVVRLPLRRRTRNHLNSMYFGALAVGADVAGGMHGLYHAKQTGCTVSLAFKSFQAQFLRRPESCVYFSCNEGELVKEMIQESQQSGNRINKLINIQAHTEYPATNDPVALFTLELSLKVIK
jgi:hypothetical protein